MHSFFQCTTWGNTYLRNWLLAVLGSPTIQTFMSPRREVPSPVVFGTPPKSISRTPRFTSSLPKIKTQGIFQHETKQFHKPQDMFTNQKSRKSLSKAEDEVQHLASNLGFCFMNSKPPNHCPNISVPQVSQVLMATIILRALPCLQVLLPTQSLSWCVLLNNSLHKSTMSTTAYCAC